MVCKTIPKGTEVKARGALPSAPTNQGVVMVIYRVPYAYLNDYQMIGQRVQVLNDMKRRDIEEQKIREMANLMAIQEAIRLQRNYNYSKDTEFLRQYAFGETIREQRLVQRASAVGLHIDRYI